VFIGLISYPLYLWHWPILAFMAILQSGDPPLSLRVAAVCVSFALATLTFWLVEMPVRKSRRLSVSTGFASLTATLGLIGLIIVYSEGFPARFGGDLTAGAPGPREDSLCRQSIPELRDINYCRRTSRTPPEVAFLGDSQAQSVYEGAVSTLGTDKPMVLLGRGGCPPALNVPASPNVYVSDERRQVCNQTWARLVNYVRSRPPEMVVLVGDDSRFFAHPAAKSSRAAETQDEHAFKAGLNELISALQPYANVIYLLEIPTFPTDPACFLRPIRLPGSNCSPSIGRRTLADARSKYKDSVLELQRAHPGMIVIDPVPALCDARSCSQISRAGEVLYHDQMHLNRIGGQRLARASGLAGVIRAETGG
jgi:SGNH domain (fused to AT3 domains)